MNTAPTLEPVEAPEQEPTLRETIESAVDASEAEQSAQPGSPPAGQPAPAAPVVAPTVPTAPTGPEGAKPAAAPGTPAAAAGTPSGAQAASVELKAPNQWKPHVREKWNTLPREVQEEVLRRESDNLRLIGSVGQKIRMADEIGQHLAPFAERLQETGASPQAFMADVFSTVKSLSSGTPQERAEVVANIVQSYGIDLRMLDSVLAQRLSAPPPDPRVIEAQRRAMAAESQLTRHNMVREQQVQQTAATTLTSFAADPKNEFFGDVRELMADLIESGRATSLEDAYAASVWANPDTRKILLQREAEQRAAQKQQRAAGARLASSSVHGTPRGSGAGAPLGSPNMSLRETIAAAMDAQDGA